MDDNNLMNKIIIKGMLWLKPNMIYCPNKASCHAFQKKQNLSTFINFITFKGNKMKWDLKNVILLKLFWTKFRLHLSFESSQL
jgi:hypothetical protein